MPDQREYVFAGEPERLDRFLTSRLSPLSRTKVQKLIDQGVASVNGKTSPAGYQLSNGDKIVVTLPDFSSLPPAAANSIPILYEDKAILVVNKPAGLVVHPAGPHQSDTLIQRLWPKLAASWSTAKLKESPSATEPGEASPFHNVPRTAARRRRESSTREWLAGLKSETIDRPGVVHRLDKGTSGTMVIAKTPQAAEKLAHQFASRSIKKIYWALVRGIPKARKGRIESMVGRSHRNPARMSTTDPGRWSETEFTVLERFPSFGEQGAALLEVRPLTGRTHQIRVQLAALGHPILGDSLYGTDRAVLAGRPLRNASGTVAPSRHVLLARSEVRPSALARPLLHAYSLEITHPSSGKRMSWKIEPPDDFALALTSLGWKKSG